MEEEYIKLYKTILTLKNIKWNYTRAYMKIQKILHLI